MLKTPVLLTSILMLFVIGPTPSYAYTPANGYEQFTTPACGPLYGNPWVGDGDIDNEELGGSASKQWIVSFRFQSAYNANVTGFKFMGEWGSSPYGKGTGGRIRVSLHNDNGSGLPDPTILTEATIVHPINNWEQYGGIFLHPKIDFPTPYAVQQETTYHMVLWNTDPDPANNYISVNGPFAESDGPTQQCLDESGSKILFARLTDTNPWTSFKTLHTSGGNTVDMGIHTIPHEIYFDNGTFQGIPTTHARDWLPIEGTKKWRQVFIPTQTLQSTGAGGRISGNGNTSGGALTISLYNSASGSKLAECTIPRSDITPGCAGGSCGFRSGQVVADFVRCNWPETTLQANTQYSLEFSSQQGILLMNTVKTGGNGGSGFGYESAFSDGYAQYYNGSSWQDFNRDGPRTEDLSFFISLSRDSVVNQCGPSGDLDCSGEVNLFDLSTLLSHFGFLISIADIDSSGEVNLLDLSGLLGNYGK